MWVIPSHARAEKLKQLCDSFGEQDLKQPVLVVLSEADEKRLEYAKILWPETWTFVTADKNYSYCGEKMNFAFKMLPDSKFYGHLCDDVLIGTKNRLHELVEDAGDWYISYPNDGVYHGDLACFPVCGGNLVRTWGWWAHPWFKHNCLDSVIDDIGRSLGILKYRSDIRYNLTHPIWGTADWDETYLRVQEINLEAGYIFDTRWRGSKHRAEVLDYTRRKLKEAKAL